MNIVGVDIGGTFTDLVGVIDGEVVTSKTSTVPADPTAGVAESLRLANCDPRKLAEVLHGSTIAINTVLERKGAQTALLTTRGFRDVYGIGRSNRIEAFNLFFHRPKPLTRREMTFEVDERLNAAGQVIRPLDERQIESIARQLRERRIEAVAVCFLHSYANPAHERLAGEVLRRSNPDMFVTLSHEILREFREYERTSTTVLNAYVGPRVRDYLGTLETYLRRENFDGKVHMMRSNGGVMSIRKAQEEPVSMMESGPVAGMIGAGRLASHLGIARCIGFDMGGTTAKASLITDGMPAVEEGYVIGTPASGQPMQLPVVDIVEVGAGGGSIAWVDPTGGLHVGPKSAGADPGPACYGKGSADPVVTDADLVLGRINPDRFLNGGMKLDVAAARKAVQEKVAKPLGLSIEEAALGIATIADSAMSLAVRAVSVNKGVDPRDTTMIAFGGAGPLHAVNIARQIFIPRVVVPKVPGTFSALGMLMASWRQDFVRTFIGRIGSLDAAATRAVLAELAGEGRAQLKRDGVSAQGADFRFFADLRYVGQEHTLPIRIDDAGMLTRDTSALRDLFHVEHDKRYGQAAVDEQLEIVNLRLVLTSARADTIAEEWLAQKWWPAEQSAETSRHVIYGDAAKPVESRVLWRPAMKPGDVVVGPAVIEEPNSTILIHPGDRVMMTPAGHLIIDLAFEA
ncbi:MAG TPA: hydantoinase/oxoprolinase family protein [Xanthobacteraceae bacterium]|jgi:N-methylhydantoinase A|nr:hydantoinase/oxoprolinase family protein [Xanthobacteraceae bacterium]